MKLPRRRFLHLAGSAVALPVILRTAHAQDYPNRYVRFIVHLNDMTKPDHWRAA